MAKRLSNTQKDEIIKRFSSGEDIVDLSEEYGYTKLTVTRNLKKALGQELFNKLILKTQSSNKLKIKSKELEKISSDNFDSLSKANSGLSFVSDSLFNESTFVEIPPFECEFNDESISLIFFKILLIVDVFNKSGYSLIKSINSVKYK